MDSKTGLVVNEQYIKGPLVVVHMGEENQIHLVLELGSTGSTKFRFTLVSIPRFDEYIGRCPMKITRRDFVLSTDDKSYFHPIVLF